MTRRKNPFKNQLFSKIYTCAYEHEKSGYELSKEIYGYDKKAHHILQIIRKNPNYFKQITQKDSKHPKYISKATPLVNKILQGIDIDTNTKRLLKNTLESKSFRTYINYKMGVKTINDITIFISILASSIYVLRHHYFPKLDEFRKIGFDFETMKNIYGKLEKIYKKNVPSNIKDIHNTDFLNLGTIVGDAFKKLPEDLINHLIKLSPYAHIMPQTTIAVLKLNDQIWEMKLSKMKNISK